LQCLYTDSATTWHDLCLSFIRIDKNSGRRNDRNVLGKKTKYQGENAQVGVPITDEPVGNVACPADQAEQMTSAAGMVELEHFLPGML